MRIHRAQIQASIADLVFKEFADPYTFPSYHKRILEPYNYYEFGQRYVASLTDFSRSLLGHPERWNRIASLLEKGENVVLLANHQTEADPGGLGVTDALSTVDSQCRAWNMHSICRERQRV